jgi:hypothetical protein
MVQDSKQIISLQEGKMSLILDTYNDIFSSFDPREYDEKSLSDDFLDECKKIVLDKWVDVIELRLMIPDTNRENHNEEVIKKRLHSYFLQQVHHLEKRRKKETIQAWLLVVLWIIVWLIVSYILHTYAFAYLFTTMITVIGEPASWLFIWNWAERILKQYRGETDNEFQFAQRLSHAKIKFYWY